MNELLPKGVAESHISKSFQISVNSPLQFKTTLWPWLQTDINEIFQMRQYIQSDKRGFKVMRHQSLQSLKRQK